MFAWKNQMIKVLGLCSYPIESAATRYRLAQFVEPLTEKEISLEVSPFLDSEQFKFFYNKRSMFSTALKIWKPFLRRLLESFRMRKYDLLLVQREAMIFGPVFFERLFQRIGNIPLILDLDDATYISYVSPTYGRFGSFFKFFGKTDNLITRADVVICGNRFIAKYVQGKGTKTAIIPTVVDTDKFYPIERKREVPVIGWVGTHSTFPLLKSVFPVLQKLAKKHEFVLKVVGAGAEHIILDGVQVENKMWSLETEISDFQSLDIGLYPMATSASASDEWLLGKSGFKAIQYLAVGVPFVVTPIGVCAEIGEADVSHFEAVTEEDWYDALDILLTDRTRREKMGKAGRNFALRDFTIGMHCEKLKDILEGVYEKSRNLGL